MSDEAKAPPAQVADLRVWYHFPISLLHDVTPANMTGWTEEKRDRSQTDASQVTYFHPYIAAALFHGGKGARFKVYRRTGKPQRWKGEFCETDLYQTKVFYSRFKICVTEVELWVAAQDGRKASPDDPALGILSVAVQIKAVAKAEKPLPYDPHALDGVKFRRLTLNDAMDALEWVRRVFPRWRIKGMGMPGDSLSQVIDPKGLHLPAHSEAGDEAAYQAQGTLRLSPWVERLLDPIKVDGVCAIHLGDERAFMSSAIALRNFDGKDDRASLRAVPDGTLFRLAEADRAWSGDYAYNSGFLESLRERYFYTRHAPDRTEGREHIGNSTLYLMSQHHLCALGTGWFAANDMITYMDRYYRYMQFLCVFEYFRLIQFSQRLTRLVERHRDTPPIFRAEVLKIREDFLTHTHLHHFTNVSSQLQAKEMFDKLQAVTGIPEMFAEVERELQSAADYAAMLEASEQAKRGEELNNLVAIGVPASLALTVAGFAWVTGDKAPDVAEFDIGGSPFTAGLVQVSALVTLALGVWVVLRWALKKPVLRRVGSFGGLLAMLGLTLILLVFHESSVGKVPESNPSNTLPAAPDVQSQIFTPNAGEMQKTVGNPSESMQSLRGLQRVSLQTLPG